MSDCLHRRKRLVIDPYACSYAVQCAECFVTAEESPSGMQAYIAWLRERRLESNRQEAAA